MSEGIVKWFNPRKGYGFIETNAGKDVFVHYADIEQKNKTSLTQGQLVSFHITPGEKGPKALHVVALKNAAKD